jgi:hypothetical protein
LIPDAYSGADSEKCFVPGTTTEVDVPVNSQCQPRKGQVYCSCRCDGEDSAAKYCECPEGYDCKEVTRSLDPTLIAPGDKYCVKQEDKVSDGYTCDRGFGCHEVAGGCGFTKNAYEF